MSSRAIKSALLYLSCLSGLAVVVGLLTMLFSFLGTVSCAVLTGMAVGATRHQRWQAIPAGFVFPAVIFATVHWSRDDFLTRKMWDMSLLCLGAFFVTYAVSSLLLFCEAKKPVSTALPEGEASSGNLDVQAELTAAVTQPPAAPLTLADLEGQWCQAATGSNGDGRQKRIDISDGKVVLRIVHSDGRVQIQAQGQLELANHPLLCRADPHRIASC